MRTSDRSASRPCSVRVSQTLEPPWYGPVCLVVGEGRRREAPPYPDQFGFLAVLRFFTAFVN